MPDFKSGDIVKLKCSPQKMVVHTIGPFAMDDPLKCIYTGSMLCVWIEDYGVPHREIYVEDVLMLDDGEGDRVIKEILKRKQKEETEF